MKIISTLSKMWLKVTNLENSLFPQLQTSLGVLSSKEEKLIKILDFAQIEQAKRGYFYFEIKGYLQIKR